MGQPEVPRACFIEVIREDPGGGVTRARWEFAVDSFDAIVATITERGGPPYFEEIFSAEEMVALAKISEQALPYGIRWGKYINDDLPTDD